MTSSVGSITVGPRPNRQPKESQDYDREFELNVEVILVQSNDSRVNLAYSSEKGVD